MPDAFTPIRLQGRQPFKNHEIVSVVATLGFLFALWPGNTGHKKAAAEQACRQALAGNISPEEARQAFFDAAWEAGILER